MVFRFDVNRGTFNHVVEAKMFEGVFLCKKYTELNQRPMGHNTHLNVELWRLYSAKIL